MRLLFDAQPLAFCRLARVPGTPYLIIVVSYVWRPRNLVIVVSYVWCPRNPCMVSPEPGTPVMYGVPGTPEPRLKRYGKQVGPLTPGTVWTF